MATVKENLIAARALIDTPEKWGKDHNLVTGVRCATLACSAVTNGPGDLFYRMRTALELALPVQTDDPMAVVHFNDDPDTTHADIMALFQRAIDAEEAKEAQS